MSSGSRGRWKNAMYQECRACRTDRREVRRLAACDVDEPTVRRGRAVVQRWRCSWRTGRPAPSWSPPPNPGPTPVVRDQVDRSRRDWWRRPPRPCRRRATGAHSQLDLLARPIGRRLGRRSARRGTSRSSRSTTGSQTALVSGNPCTKRIGRASRFPGFGDEEGESRSFDPPRSAHGTHSSTVPAVAVEPLQWWIEARGRAISSVPAPS